MEKIMELLSVQRESSHTSGCFEWELTYFWMFNAGAPTFWTLKVKAPTLLVASSESSHTFERLKREHPHLWTYKAGAPILLSA